MPLKKHIKKMKKCYKLEDENINSSPNINGDEPLIINPSLDYWNDPNLMIIPIIVKKCEK